jgi:hypothetical protein
MSESGSLDADLRDDAVSWAQICLEFHDLRRGANRHLLVDRFRALLAASRAGADQLKDWLAFRKEIIDRDDEEEQYARNHFDGNVLDSVDLFGIGFDETDAQEYVCPTRCPTRQCARRAAALFGEPPPCDLRDRPMVLREQR